MESIFHHVGNCGWFQICNVFLIQSLRFVASWALSLMMFGNYEPPWQCVKYMKHLNGTFPNTSFTLNPHSSHHNKNLDFENTNSTRNTAPSNDAVQSMTWIVRNSMNGQINDTAAIFYKGTCQRLAHCDDIIFDPTTVTVVSDFGLICDQAYIPSAIIAGQMLGMAVGCSLGGHLGEAFGRKKNNYGSLILMSVATIASSWSISWCMHLGLFFLIGVGGGGIIASNQVYTLEFLDPKWRGRFGAVPVGNLAIVFFACIVLASKNWRQVNLVCGVMGSLFVLGAIWVPESLRWLNVHEKEDESKKVLSKIMKYNKIKGDVTEVLQKLKEQKGRDETTSGHRFTYFDLFRTSEIRSMTIKVGIIWSAALTTYYTLSFSVKAFSGDYYTNLFLSCLSEIPFVLPLYFSVNTLGRKITTSIFLLLSSMTSIACVIVYYTASEEVSGPMIKYLAITAKNSTNMIWMIMIVYCTELFPTVVRNLAVGFFSTIARIWVILGTTLIPRDQESLAICFFVLSGFLVIAFMIVLTLPETKNRPLNDTIKKGRWEENEVSGSDLEREVTVIESRPSIS